MFLQATERRNIDPPVQLEPYFPPAKPSLENLNAVCVHGSGRPRYPASCLPFSGYGYIRCAGTAVNRVEAWFSQCCQRGVAQGDQQIAKQAWETALSHFCIEEHGTMTLVHECCEKKGEERWNCFEKQAPNPSYQPLSGYAAPIIPPDRIFTWDPNTSDGRNIDPPVQLEPYFPPAKPSLENLNAVCVHGNGRPRYPASCLPSSGYGYIRRAGIAVNRVEAWFSQCCQRGVAQGDQQVLCCAKQAWETALSHFCIEEHGTMTLVHECCEKKGEERWNCFEKQAPNPSYQPLSGYTAPVITPDRIFTWDPNNCK
ncbi:extracellular matrix 1-like protein [Labeo rohita]|uniref:Extracellular matrix 1-like protein n=1 Tax=Labeo rohita TaxID=84645 RepID=A0A498NC62_LABRO|nr:extracellular matrix 1-like protein [Labeo rohita]RXN28546.1 extracellular matrix 1-like protein [Labeo rohita]